MSELERWNEMVISRCCICDKAITGPGMGRQGMVTVEKYSDSGCSVVRYILCDEHLEEIREMLNPVSDELAKTARCCGND